MAAARRYEEGYGGNQNRGNQTCTRHQTDAATSRPPEHPGIPDKS